MTPNYVLCINDLHLNTSIGVFEYEKLSPQPLILNVKITATPPANLHADSYDNVVCYKTIVDTITSTITSRHYELVETVCHAVAQICFDDNRVLSVWVQATKPNAIETCQSVGVEMTFAKP